MKKRNVEGLNSLEIVGTTSYFEFLIEPQVVSSLLDFVGMGFSLRKLQESKSDVSLSSVLWFVNSSKVNFDCAGMKLKVVESCDAPNNAFAINIGRIFVEEFPSQELLSSYSSEGSVDLTSKTFDEDASLSLPLVNDSSKPAEKLSSPTKAKDLPEAQPETPSFNLITLNVKKIIKSNYLYTPRNKNCMHRST